MKAAVKNARINHQLFALNALTLLISSSMVHAYLHVLRVQSFSEINAFNAQIIVFNALLQHHVQNVLHHTIIIQESVILTATLYLSNMM